MNTRRLFRQIHIPLVNKFASFLRKILVERVKERTELIMLYLSPQEKARCQVFTKSQGRSLDAQLRYLVEQAIKQAEK